MSSNKRDENRQPNIAGVSSLDYTGNIEPAVNPSTHALLVEAITDSTGLDLGNYDYISYTSGLTDDTYVFKTGGSGGTTTATLVVTWTDANKDVLSSVAKT